MAANPQALGADSPIVSEVTFTSGTGFITLDGPGPRGNWFRFNDVYDDGVTIAIVVSDDSGQKEALFALFRAPETLVPQIMIISTNGNTKINWPTTGQRIVKPMLGVVPPQNPVYIPGAPPIGPTPGACLCPTPTTPPPPPPPGTSGPLSFEPATGVKGYFHDTEPATLTHSLTLTTTHPNEVIILHVGMAATSSPPIPSTVVNSPSLSWTKRIVRSGTNSFSNHLVVEVWWAPAVSPLASEIITVNVTGSLGFITVEAVPVIGAANIAAPWDTNPSLPAVAENMNGSPASVTEVPGIFTDHSNDMIFLFYNDSFGVYLISAIGPVMFTSIILENETQSFGTLGIDSAVLEGLTTVPLVNAAITAHRTFPALDGPIQDWILIADAIRGS